MSTTEARRVDRLVTVRSHDGDSGCALGELLELPGIECACMDHVTGAFNVTFDAGVVSDEELAATLAHHGFEVVGWQEARIMQGSQQRQWLIDQIRSLGARSEVELAERGAYAEGVTKGAVDAYARAGRAFGLVTDAEIRELIPPRFLESEGRAGR